MANNETATVPLICRHARSLCLQHRSSTSTFPLVLGVPRASSPIMCGFQLQLEADFLACTLFDIDLLTFLAFQSQFFFFDFTLSPRLFSVADRNIVYCARARLSCGLLRETLLHATNSVGGPIGTHNMATRSHPAVLPSHPTALAQFNDKNSRSNWPALHPDSPACFALVAGFRHSGAV
jgi:hypothetical protein